MDLKDEVILLDFLDLELDLIKNFNEEINVSETYKKEIISLKKRYNFLEEKDFKRNVILMTFLEYIYS